MNRRLPQWKEPSKVSTQAQLEMFLFFGFIALLIQSNEDSADFVRDIDIGAGVIAGAMGFCLLVEAIRRVYECMRTRSRIDPVSLSVVAATSLALVSLIVFCPKMYKQRSYKPPPTETRIRPLWSSPDKDERLIFVGINRSVVGVELLFASLMGLATWATLKNRRTPDEESSQLPSEVSRATTGVNEAPAQKVVAPDQAESPFSNINPENTRSRIDPELLAEATEYSLLVIEDGLCGFAKWARHMLTTFGEGLRPYLKQIYMSAASSPDAEKLNIDDGAQVLGMTQAQIDEAIANEQDEGAKSEAHSDVTPDDNKGDRYTSSYWIDNDLMQTEEEVLLLSVPGPRPTAQTYSRQITRKIEFMLPDEVAEIPDFLRTIGLFQAADEVEANDLDQEGAAQQIREWALGLPPVHAMMVRYLETNDRQHLKRLRLPENRTPMPDKSPEAVDELMTNSLALPHLMDLLAMQD